MYEKIRSDFYLHRGFLVGELQERLKRLLFEGETVVGIYDSVMVVAFLTDKRIILMNTEYEDDIRDTEFFPYKNIITVDYLYADKYPSKIVSVNIDRLHTLRFVCDSNEEAENFTKMLFGFMGK